jgi:hypothetical protein
MVQSCPGSDSWISGSQIQGRGHRRRNGGRARAVWVVRGSGRDTAGRLISVDGGGDTPQSGGLPAKEEQGVEAGGRSSEEGRWRPDDGAEKSSRTKTREGSRAPPVVIGCSFENTIGPKSSESDVPYLSNGASIMMSRPSIFLKG